MMVNETVNTILKYLQPSYDESQQAKSTYGWRFGFRNPPEFHKITKHNFFRGGNTMDGRKASKKKEM